MIQVHGQADTESIWGCDRSSCLVDRINSKNTGGLWKDYCVPDTTESSSTTAVKLQVPACHGGRQLL